MLKSERELAAYAAGEFVCAICDGGPANECACSCAGGPVAPASWRRLNGFPHAIAGMPDQMALMLATGFPARSPTPVR